jgi:hypothetical protein
VAEVIEGVVGPTQLRSPEGEAEEHHVVRTTDPALGLVDREPEALGQVPRDTGLDAITGTLAAHEDQKIVSLAHEPMSASFQLTVEVVQQDVGEQRRKDSSHTESNLEFGALGPPPGGPSRERPCRRASFHRQGGQCCYSYRRLSPHQPMPMPGVHDSFKPTPLRGAA